MLRVDATRRGRRGGGVWNLLRLRWQRTSARSLRLWTWPSRLSVGEMVGVRFRLYYWAIGTIRSRYHCRLPSSPPDTAIRHDRPRTGNNGSTATPSDGSSPVNCRKSERDFSSAEATNRPTSFQPNLLWHYRWN